jgi:hypothetical protein
MPRDVLEIHCNRCRVSKFCEKNGAAPLRFQGKDIPCRIIGGFGRKPIAVEKLSEKSKELAVKNGPCLTLAEVPYVDEGSGVLTYDVVKIFSPPNLHPREKTTGIYDMMYPQTFNPKQRNAKNR